jgi:hypothetical protein
MDPRAVPLCPQTNPRMEPAKNSRGRTDRRTCDGWERRAAVLAPEEVFTRVEIVVLRPRSRVAAFRLLQQAYNVSQNTVPSQSTRGREGSQRESVRARDNRRGHTLVQ